MLTSRLNFDVLSNVLYFVALDSFPDVSAMMCTCRALYHEGAKVLLQLDSSDQDDPDSWVRDDNIAAYDRFVRAEGGARLPFVTALTLATTWEDASTAVMITNLFPALPALSRLRVNYADDCRRNAPATFRMILESLALEDLRLHNAMDAVLHMIPSLQHSVHSLGIELISDDSLRPFLPDPPAPSPHTRLPSIERLTLWIPHTHLHVSPWLEAFPNIKTLRISQSMWSRPSEEVRDSNSAAMRTVRGWPLLTHVEGEPLMLYTLGFSHTLTRLGILIADPQRSDMEMLGRVLGDTLPRVLSLHFELEHPDDPHDKPESQRPLEWFLLGVGFLEQAFALAPGLPVRLRELILRIDVRNCCQAVEASTIDALMQAITTVPLESLDITLGTKCYFTAAELVSLDLSHAEMDVDEFASRCMLGSQTLQRVEFTVLPCPSCQTNKRQAAALSRG